MQKIILFLLINVQTNSKICFCGKRSPKSHLKLSLDYTNPVMLTITKLFSFVSKYDAVNKMYNNIYPSMNLDNNISLSTRQTHSTKTAGLNTIGDNTNKKYESDMKFVGDINGNPFFIYFGNIIKNTFHFQLVLRDKEKNQESLKQTFEQRDVLEKKLLIQHRNNADFEYEICINMIIFVNKLIEKYNLSNNKISDILNDGKNGGCEPTEINYQESFREDYQKLRLQKLLALIKEENSERDQKMNLKELSEQNSSEQEILEQTKSATTSKNTYKAEEIYVSQTGEEINSNEEDDSSNESENSERSRSNLKKEEFRVEEKNMNEISTRQRPMLSFSSDEEELPNNQIKGDTNTNLAEETLKLEKKKIEAINNVEDKILVPTKSEKKFDFDSKIKNYEEIKKANFQIQLLMKKKITHFTSDLEMMRNDKLFDQENSSKPIIFIFDKNLKNGNNILKKSDRNHPGDIAPNDPILDEIHINGTEEQKKQLEKDLNEYMRKYYFFLTFLKFLQDNIQNLPKNFEFKVYDDLSTNLIEYEKIDLLKAEEPVLYKYLHKYRYTRIFMQVQEQYKKNYFRKNINFEIDYHVSPDQKNMIVSIPDVKFVSDLSEGEIEGLLDEIKKIYVAKGHINENTILSLGEKEDKNVFVKKIV